MYQPKRSEMLEAKEIKNKTNKIMENDSNLEKINKSIDAIKKLIILQLLTSGVTSEIVGKTLGIDSSRIRHMVSTKNTNKNKNAGKK